MKSIKLIALTLVIVLVACVFVSCNPQERALDEARKALTTYLNNKARYDTGLVLYDGDIFIVEKSGKWYSFQFINGKLEKGKVFETAPTDFKGYVLEENEEYLLGIPENVTIYIPKP